MKKGTIWLKLFCMAGVLLCLTGCGKDRYALKTEVSQVYKATVIEIPDADYGITLDEGAVWNGERFVVTAYKHDREMGGFWLDFHKTYSFLPDGTGILEEVPVPAAEPVQENSFPADVRTLENEETLFTEVVTAGEKIALYVSVRNEQGEPVFSVDLAGAFRFDYNRVREGSDYFELLGAVASEGRYLVLTTEGLCAFDPSGTLLWMNDTQRNPTAIAATDAGILYLYGSTPSQSLRFVDPATGELGENLELPEEAAGAEGDSSEFYMGAGHDLYAKNSLALWGIDLVIGEDGTVACETVKVIDWISSDLVAAELDDFCIPDERTMTAVWHDMLDFDADNQLLLLTYVPPEEVVQKEIITLAKLTYDWSVQRAITDFNRNSDTHRIVVTDYTIYEDDVKWTLFDAEMAAGNVPDILLYAEDGANKTDGYIRAGVLTDLTPYITEHFENELLGHVTKPYQETDGRQFIFPTSPTASPYMGLAGFFDGPITAEEALELAVNPPEGYCLLPSQRDEFWYILQGIYGDLTDTDQGTCDFDSGRFEEIYRQVADWESTEKREETPLLRSKSISSVGSWVQNRMEGKYTVPVGYPNDAGDLYIEGSFGACLAVTEKSQHTLQCIEFIERYTCSKSEYSGTFYYAEDVYRNLKQYEGITVYLTPEGPKNVPDWWFDETSEMYDPSRLTGITGESYKITRADADEFIAFLNSIDATLQQSTELYDIYRAEVMNPDNRPAEEVADAIQSRASIYLAENS
ncbi:MAG: hypothetical protein IKY52_08065 [Clostridia bacterium]|nr:hypothetical protein [Clostridia bacterium]